MIVRSRVANARGAHITPGEPRGQSLVEFGLVLPLLLVLLLGVADFGRVFAASITSEAAARNAAEAAAQEYLQLDLLDGNQDGSLLVADYQDLHDRALAAACRDAERLPDRILDGSGSCLMPIIAVCVHDNAGIIGQGDPACPEASGPVPGDCGQMVSPGWSPAQLAPASTPYVEVRLCYRFDPLITALMGNWGSVWLQRENYFTVQSY
jgi:hypothetical protein